MPDSLERKIAAARKKLQEAELVLEHAEGRDYVTKCHRAVDVCNEELMRLQGMRVRNKPKPNEVA